MVEKANCENEPARVRARAREQATTIRVTRMQSIVLTKVMDSFRFSVNVYISKFREKWRKRER